MAGLSNNRQVLGRQINVQHSYSGSTNVVSDLIQLTLPTDHSSSQQTQQSQGESPPPIDSFDGRRLKQKYTKETTPCIYFIQEPLINPRNNSVMGFHRALNVLYKADKKNRPRTCIVTTPNLDLWLVPEYSGKDVTTCLLPSGDPNKPYIYIASVGRSTGSSVNNAREFRCSSILRRLIVILCDETRIGGPRTPNPTPRSDPGPIRAISTSDPDPDLRPREL